MPDLETMKKLYFHRVLCDLYEFAVEIVLGSGKGF
jgi:hypothetical protein